MNRPLQIGEADDNQDDHGSWREAAGPALRPLAGRHGSRHIAEPILPATRARGYAVQALLERAAHDPLFGWKIAATSAAGQAHINVDGPLAGRILAERVVPEGVPVRLGANRMRVAEVEFAFRMGQDLSPRA